MIEAIVAGERDANKLLELCVSQLQKKKGEQIVKSLQGHYRSEHIFALKQALNTWHYYNSLITECDKEIEIQLEKMTKDKEDKDRGNPRKPIRYNHPQIAGLHKSLLKLSDGKDPINIAGITDYGFLQIMSEVGTDMSHWPTEKHFTSWLKVAPMRSSSGKMSKRISMKRHNKAGQLFRNVAQGVLNSKHLALGSFGRRIRARKGSGVAIKAVARKIATYYYRVMTKGTLFVEKGIEQYEQFLKERQVKQLHKMALKHNMILINA
jgi:transposase